MKNKFTLILLLIMILGVSPAFAADASVENLDILDYQVVVEGCVGCGKELELMSLENKYIENVSLMGQSQYECPERADHDDSNTDKCDFVFNISYNISDKNGLKYVYSVEEFGDISDEDDIVDVNTAYELDEYPRSVEKDHNEKIDEYKKKYLDNIKDLYKLVNIRGVDYYIYTGLLEENSFNRNLYVYNDGISLVSFDKENIDLYWSINDSDRNVTRVDNEYQIINYYLDGISDKRAGKEPNTKLNIVANENAIFFVCNDCRKCQDCHKNVAVSGASVNEEITLSKYCAVHTCAFIWRVKVANESHEGLICKEKRGNADYCVAHTCKVCSDKPIVGVNTNMILTATDKVNHFTGKNEYAYSNYCAEDFCKEYGCRNPRVIKNAAGKEYCEQHAGVCSYPKCINKITKKYEGKFLCEEHSKMTLSTTKCPECDQPFYGEECLNCKFDRTIYDISVELQKEGIEVEGRNVPAEYIAWYSTDILLDENITVVSADALSKCTHGEDNRYTTTHNPGGTWYHLEYTICKTCGPLKSEEVKHTYSDGKCKCGADEKDKVTEKTPCAGEHIWAVVYGRIPNFQDEAAFAREYHCVYKKCTICSTTDGTVAYGKHEGMVVTGNSDFMKCTLCGFERFIDYAPDGCCLNCGKEGVGGSFCEECAKLGLSGNDAGYCSKCSKRRILDENGVCKQCSKSKAPDLDPDKEIEISSTVAITINPIMSYSTCKHNHPILSDIKVTWKSNSTHTQEWTCAGCYKELSQDFNHTPLRNGKCICEI